MKNNNIDTTDFDTFLEDTPWFLQSTDTVDFLDGGSKTILSLEFQKVFSKLSILIQQARVLNLTVNNQPYRLFSWTNIYGLCCGWMNKIEPTIDSELKFIEEHKVLLKEIGGIQETYNEPEPSLTNNQNFLFIASECIKGIGELEEYYEDLCKEEDLVKMECKDFITFVVEANGAVTVYNSISKEVMLFSHDNGFDDVECLEDQPEGSFYTINEIVTFVDYVERIAEEWSAEIDL
jgi:hypothetical protein